MAETLTQIAEQLKNSSKKVQLIYAFNGIGKTRLSREFTKLVSPISDSEESELTRNIILYYNAFTEDLDDVGDIDQGGTGAEEEAREASIEAIGGKEDARNLDLILVIRKHHDQIRWVVEDNW